MTKRGRNRWNLGILVKRFLTVFYLLLLHICYSFLFICLYFHTCGDVHFWVFQERQVHFDQNLLPLQATFRFEVLDWDLWCNWAFYCNRAILVFEHFILYVSFVMDCQRGRLLGSKILEQLANHEHKLVYI